MIQDHKSTSDSDDEHRNRILNAGTEAQALINHRLFVGFFSKQTIEAMNAFAKLPDNCTVDDYKAIHMRLKDINLLKNDLERYILSAQDETNKLNVRKDIDAKI